MKKPLIILAIITVAAGIVWLAAKSPTAPEKAGGQKQESLSIKGSDTELQLVSNLVEAFNQENPQASISVAGGGSGTGIAALLNGEIDIANSSRPMKPKERDQAKSKGLEVQEFIIARDGLAIIAHPSNPIEAVSFDDVGKLYRGEITNWKSVGGSDKSVVLYGRQTTSGTYVFFRDAALKGDYDPRMKNMEGSQAIVDAVKNDKNGIGYVGIGYIVDETDSARKDIKLVKIATASETSGISPLDTEKIKTGAYPLARPLFQYVAGLPQKESLAEKFLLFESSAEGFAVTAKTGFFPPTQEDIAQNEILFEAINQQ